MRKLMVATAAGRDVDAIMRACSGDSGREHQRAGCDDGAGTTGADRTILFRST